MLIDCDTCAHRGTRCGDCVISVLLDDRQAVDLDETEQRAVHVLAAGGLVPPLRLASIDSSRRRRSA